MAFTKDDHLEDSEAEAEAARHSNMLLDAAVWIEQGVRESEALARARVVAEAQADAAGDETHVLDTLEEAQSPRMPADAARRRVVEAIHKRLLAASV